MFFRTNHLQFDARPERPDPIYAKQLQEVLGGQWGEMSVMISYLFQGWNCRGPEKYKDMIMDIGTRDCPCRNARHNDRAAARNLARRGTGGRCQEQPCGRGEGGSRIADVLLGGMNPQHAIVNGMGASPNDSVGYPWNARYTIASGNLLADFRYNVTAESQGRLRVSRLYNLTEDRGVKRMLAFMIARDTMHQNQWLAAIEELQADGLEETPVPSNFPQELEDERVSYQFWNCSGGTESKEGRWAAGTTPDGKGKFEYLSDPKPMSDDTGLLGNVEPRLYGTPKKPVPKSAT